MLIKVEALDYERDSPEEVIKVNLPHRKEKVTTIGRLYDLAHQKGLPDSEEENDPNVEKKAGTEEGTQTEDAAEVAAVPAAAPSPVTINIGTTPDKESDSDSGDDDEEKEPWNATCVVGLRVYSKQPELGVKVVRPPKPKQAETIKTPAQDRDAITKAPQEEVEKKGTQVEDAGENKGKEKEKLAEDAGENKERKKEKQEEYADIMAKRPGSRHGQVGNDKKEESDDEDEESDE